MLEEERLAKQAKREMLKTGTSDNSARQILNVLMQPNLLYRFTKNISQGVQLPKVKPCLAIFRSQHRGQVFANLESQDLMNWKYDLFEVTFALFAKYPR